MLVSSLKNCVGYDKLLFLERYVLADKTIPILKPYEQQSLYSYSHEPPVSCKPNEISNLLMHYDSFTNGLRSLKPPLMKTVNESVRKRSTTF